MLSDEDIEAVKALTQELRLPLGRLQARESDTQYLDKLLQDVNRLPIHNLNNLQKFIPRQMKPERVYDVPRKELHLDFQFERDSKTGVLLGFKEAYKGDYGCNAQNSLSMTRRPGPPTESLKGDSTNIPFWPGGLDLPNMGEDDQNRELDALDFNKELKTVPPGFENGMNFERRNVEWSDKVMELSDLVTDDKFFEIAKPNTKSTDGGEEDESDEVGESAGPRDTDASFEELVSDLQVEKRVRYVHEPPEILWAVDVDISSPVADFHQKIPDMARKYPFELDTFQKQAILHLEKGDCVFVAAHTSAGKTVVAEYAIALSLKHRTRAVYTSPIKALSNQKFREFSVTFDEDVGLITGDVQLRQESSCLIMTTEILRSMLYNGSNVIRDLEWVIFDEVHYINDKERGVVWEEVLIMLPKDVNIILLSATVPNTLEFADWIGRTKKRNIYVIKTLKRPVPLEHFLYTGNSNKTSKELFQVVDSKGTFIRTGHQKAIDAKKGRASKSSQTTGAKGPRHGNPKQDKSIWLSIIHMLQGTERLPVIAFTFSKNKIEENIYHLQSMDLTTATEKSRIKVFCRKSIARLKGTDARLPQVIGMQELLVRGIGKHHSGVLPIMREMVEILFQRGLVKVLFATETFAMGVNMPARTVVFDSIRKHDGTSFRNLQPGEYIQMAGRAGRRGLDSTGQVIILCKGDVPDTAELQIMMLGLPTKLESQFRLTYSMILNLLRVKQLRIEDMIKRSFAETESRKDAKAKEQRLKELGEKLQNLKTVNCQVCTEDIGVYYETLKDFRSLDKELKKKKYSHPAAVKMMVGGRVVTAVYKGRPSLSVILKSVVPPSEKVTERERLVTILTICDPKAEDVTSRPEFQRYQKLKLFCPEGEVDHIVQEVTVSELVGITRVTLKIAADKIIENINKRKMPRFKNDPPSQSVLNCVQELVDLTRGNPDGFEDVDPVNDLHIRDIETVEKFKTMQKLKSAFGSFHCEQCFSFEHHFRQECYNMIVEDEYRDLKFQLSDESLKLLPEYAQRLDVLRTLRYIDDHDTIQLKGRVATMISSHELLITELLTEDVFTPLDPEEMAALLSCIVFEQKNVSEPELNGRLKQGTERIKEIALNIGKVQRHHKMAQPPQDFVDSLHFGLVEVVYEWARGTPFHEITTLTDVQEGIIVRCIQRLNEILLDVRNAARSVGNPTLADRLEIASMMIKRDIVFTASLYIQQD